MAQQTFYIAQCLNGSQYIFQDSFSSYCFKNQLRSFSVATICGNQGLMSVTCLCHPGDIVTIHHRVSANQRASSLLLTNQSDHTSPTWDVSPRASCHQLTSGNGGQNTTDGLTGKTGTSIICMMGPTNHWLSCFYVQRAKVKTGDKLFSHARDRRWLLILYIACKRSSGNSVIVILFFRKPQLFCCILVLPNCS